MRGLSRALRTALVATLTLAAAASGGLQSPAASMRPVVVQAHDPAAAAAAVRAAGGVLGTPLPIVDGFAARVPDASLQALAAHPAVRAVTPDETVRVADHESNDDFPSDVKSVFAHEVGAPRLWADGFDGRGVRVALIDTGVTAVPDVADRLVRVPHPDMPGRTAACVDFSGEGTCRDTYGHGTFMAGLIAGTGASSDGRYTGVAPGAEIVSVKIAGRDGSADVTKVLAAIQWVVSFAPDLNIRVLNLSLGTNSRAPWRIDPLNFAVQRAWRAGIVVVVSGGNHGPAAGTISKPADDPFVITVGAVDDRETPAISDDRIPHFSARGPTAADRLAKPDVVAPGGRVISLRSRGSFVEEHAPGGGINDDYRRGSGTSMSAAVVSGAVALLVQANPSWTSMQPARWLPDRVKFAFVSTAHKVASDDTAAIGAGLIDVAAARTAPDGLANQDVTLLPLGTGALDDSRGDVLVTRQCTELEKILGDADCGYLHGNETAQGNQWDAKEFAGSDWNGSSWYESQWADPLGSSWFGSSWFGSSWFGSSWFGSSWYGQTDEAPYGTSVAGSSWYGAWS